VGFGSYKDIRLSGTKRHIGLFFARLFATSIGSMLVKIIAFNPVSLRLLLKVFQTTKTKFRVDDPSIGQGILQMELDLWRRNDVQSHFATYVLMLSLRYPRSEKIDATLYDISTHNDQYFDAEKVRGSLKHLYKKVIITTSNLKVHVPGLIATEEEVAAIIPEKLKLEVLEVHT
jgi:hypothetical protein